MNLPQAVKLFRKTFVGQEVRRQIVQDVEIAADTMGGDIRYFARVFFRENPPTGESPEQDMLQRIFNTIPPYADILCSSWRTLKRVIAGKCPEAYWRLEDEPRKETY